KVGGQLQIGLGDFFTLTPTAAYYWDDYFNSSLGLREATGYTAGIDLTWRPHELVSVSSGYTYEQLFQKMGSRSRPVNSGLTFGAHHFDWVSDIQATVHRVHAGLKTALIPKVLDLRIDMNYSTSLGRIETRNPPAPVSGTAAQNNSAKA